MKDQKNEVLRMKFFRKTRTEQRSAMKMFGNNQVSELIAEEYDDWLQEQIILKRNWQFDLERLKLGKNEQKKGLLQKQKSNSQK